MNWMTIRSVGFSYQEVYLTASSIMVGAVTRRNGTNRYTAFYCNGKIKASTTRGSFIAARDWVDGQYKEHPPAKALG